MKSALLSMALTASFLLPAKAAEDLAGTWRFALDPQNVGMRQKWFDTNLPGTVHLPGGLTEQGIGDPVSVHTPWMGELVDQAYFTDPEYAPYRVPGNIKIPFWLQPEKYYAGAAWYQRDIDIPPSWSGQEIRLSLERPHIVTRVWLDDRDLGVNDSLSTPHQYDLGAGVTPGRHRLTILVDNLRFVDVGINSHSVSDQTQGNWNGIVGRIELEPLGSSWIDDLRIYPKISARAVAVRGYVSGHFSGPVAITISGPDGKSLVSSTTTELAPDGAFEADIPIRENVQLWDEFHPNLYHLTATPAGGTARTSVFGFRDLGRDGAQLTINGHKLFLRGALDCAIFPKTGHPPTDIDSWRREFTIIKEYGLNHVRFHSWCPPEVAFVAADELGVYLQVECASWANTTTTLGDGKPVDAWIYAEADRILAAYGNHPSFTLMAYGNEPGGKHFDAYLAEWVDHYKAADPRRLYTSAAGWPPIPENEYHVFSDPRIQHWGEGLKSRVNALPPATTADYIALNTKLFHGTPVIAHEIGQWCAYPDFTEIPKYTGYLKPKNFEIFRDTLAAHHLAPQAHDFLVASGKLQAILYKEEIESALRTPNMSGFQLLGLQDFPGQGTALVGVLDAFWESKGYITPTEYRRFCSPTVPLARLPKRVFTTGETLTATIEVANFGPAPLPAALVSWTLLSKTGQSVAAGSLPAKPIPVDNGIPLGEISINLRDLPAPAAYKLVVSIDDGRFENDWDVWVYPTNVQTPVPPSITVTQTLDKRALDTLAAGGKVLWLLPPANVANDPGRGEIKFGFSPIFWNTAWTKQQAPTTLGILCDPHSPALSEFPTESHSNWQWWYPIHNGQPMILDGLPAAITPIIQVIDDWVTNRKLALAFEARVGTGKLLVCSVALDAPSDPVNAQLRHTLLDYMAGAHFHPAIEVTPAQLSSLASSK